MGRGNESYRSNGGPHKVGEQLTNDELQASPSRVSTDDNR